APGGFETLSRGYLDPAHEEYSSNNALPFRNLSVLGSGSGEADSMRANDHIGTRRGLRSLRTLHAGSYGIDANVSAGTATGGGISGSYPAITGKSLIQAYSPYPAWHKTNRNRLRRIEQASETIISPKSVLLDGTDGSSGDFIRIGTGASWDSEIGLAGSDAKPFSFSMWVNFPALPTSRDTLMSIGYNYDRTVAVESGSSGPLFRFEVPGSSANGDIKSSPDDAFSLNTWYHIVATFAGGNPAGAVSGSMALYVNGVEDVATITANLSAPYAILHSVSHGAHEGSIGAFGGDDGTQAANAYFDEVSVWSKALSAAEVLALYNNGTATDLAQHASYSDVVSWWTMGDNPNDAIDASAPGSYSLGVNSMIDEKGAHNGTPSGLAASSNASPGTQASSGITTDRFASKPGVNKTYVTGSRYDNAFVTHQIPQSDMQYAWITASATTGPLGYETASVKANGRSDDITFVDSRSEVTTMLTSSITFDGAASSGDIINIGTAAYWEALIGAAGSSAKAFSVSAWINAVSDGGNDLGTVISFGADDRKLYFNSSLALQFYVKGSTNGLATTSTLTANTW
ncbi:MAG TPA: hypothetical protein EYM99_00255, partial [Alphaproteobacteria bacterium]|nr:hypothetical protein [Alphaproteobacteria bacterium]